MGHLLLLRIQFIEILFLKIFPKTVITLHNQHVHKTAIVNCLFIYFILYNIFCFIEYYSSNYWKIDDSKMSGGLANNDFETLQLRVQLLSY